MSPTSEYVPADAASDATDAFDPFELADTLQADLDDPYPYLAEARRRAPVQEGFPLPLDIAAVEGTWFSVLGHDEIAHVLRDQDAYSSSVLGEVMGPVLGHTIVAMDEPEHRLHRALVAPAFRQKVLARWEHDLVRRVADELVDEFAARGRADLVRELTFTLPVQVIARILGLPASDFQRFQRWSIELISTPLNWERGLAASAALREYFSAFVDERRAHPGDDLVSDLADIEIEGERLDDEAVFAFLRLLLPAGVETTYRSMGSLLFGLLTHPDQLAAVVASPELLPNAIEEGLRWETPIVLIVRRATRDASLAGLDIPRGADLNVFLGSANRDERRYDRPDEFDIRRTPAPHLSFGTGPHLCLGMHLARMESRVAVGTVLDRLHDLHLDPQAPQPSIVGTVFRSPNALPVCFSA